MRKRHAREFLSKPKSTFLTQYFHVGIKNLPDIHRIQYLLVVTNKSCCFDIPNATNDHYFLMAWVLKSDSGFTRCITRFRPCDAPFLCPLFSFIVSQPPAFPRRRLTLHLSAVLAALLPASVLADDLPEVNVYAQHDAVMDALTTIYDRAALTSEGDGSLKEYLSRQPGVSVDGNGHLSLRGMGEGYTQVLVNGQQINALSGDVMLDGISMDMIERVEIVRGASASDSGAGIAGTIRIVTRQASGPMERKASVRSEFSPRGAFQHRASLATGGRSQQLEWQINASVTHSEKKTDVMAHEHQDIIGGEEFINSYNGQKQLVRSSQALLAGEVAVRPTRQDRLGLAWTAELSPEKRHTDGDFLYLYEAPSYDYLYEYRSRWRSRETSSPSWTLMPTLRWDHQTQGGGLLQAELGSRQGGGKNSYRYQTLEGNFMGGNAEDSRYRQRDWHTNLKWAQPLSNATRLTVGTQLRTERSTTTYVEEGDSFDEKLKRNTTAAFTQFNWSPSAFWSLEAGLRHEHIALTPSSESVLGTRTQNMWLPSLNIGYSPNALQRWHLQLAKTYRAPKFDDLMTHVREREGNFTQPDLGGNPGLRNETATGLELGFAQTLMQGERHAGQFKLNLFARNISNGLTKELTQYTAEDWNGQAMERWILTTVNRGKTRIWGLETGVHYELPKSSGLPVSLRADLTLTQSRITDQPSPTRLMGQSPAVLDLGFDATTQGHGMMPDRFGATLRLEAGYKSRANPQMWGKVKPLATLHLNSLWKLDSSTRLRAQLTGLGNDWRTTFYPTITPSAPGEPEVIAQSMQMRSKRFWAAALMLEKDF